MKVQEITNTNIGDEVGFRNCVQVMNYKYGEGTLWHI